MKTIPTNNQSEIKATAYKHLRDIYGPDAEFREGQYEAIEATLTHKRTLVVQKTGWGKSLVYFISARMVQGMTIVVSPLLALMDNQREFATKMGLKCLVLNGKVKDMPTKGIFDRTNMINDIKSAMCDVLFTTPETLFSDDVQEILPSIQIGLFVIDECHCISDWGHDFRLHYWNLVRVLDNLPSDVHVLGTTATANDRVVEDIEKQFGDDVFVSRGSLFRESLHIEVLKLGSKAERYAWIKTNINKLPGTGIIYCTTKRDCVNLSSFLNSAGIKARPYYSDSELEKADPNEISINDETLELFKNNDIKVIVATIKLGMGFDKSDIGFVINFQCPSSLVAYYQQIGRAGRKEGTKAYCYLMSGDEDMSIQEYFIETAFPTADQEKQVIDSLEKGGRSQSELLKDVNISSKALAKSLRFLMNQGIIYQDESRKYHRSANPYVFQGAHYEEIRDMKRRELQKIQEFINSKDCLTELLLDSLNDENAKVCKTHCSNCLGHGILDGICDPSEEDIIKCQEWMNRTQIPIIPRRRWSAIDNPFDRNSVIAVPNEVGIALAKYGEPGYGEMVAYDKYHSDEFRDELVNKAVECLREKVAEGYDCITNIPSRSNDKVEKFAKRVAQELGIKYAELLDCEAVTTQQKKMSNSHFQYLNAAAKIKLKDNTDMTSIPGKIILIDDMVDSGWTLTVAGRLLTNAGADSVFPFCLADSSETGD